MSAYCQTCGIAIFPGSPICGSCRKMVQNFQKQAARPMPQPQPVYVQQPVYYPVPYYPPQQPQGYQAPQYPQGYAQAQPQQTFSHFSGYGGPPTVDNIADTRQFHPLYFIACGLWLTLGAIGVVGYFCPLLFVLLLWRPIRVLAGVMVGYW